MIKYIIGYVIALLTVYSFNDCIIGLLEEKQALVKFVELTLPLTIPSLVYFFQVSKDRKERVEKEKQEEEKSES